MSLSFTVFGSCLSANIALNLRKKGYNFLGALRHVRSDVFLDALDGDSGLSLSSENVEDLLHALSFRNERSKKRTKNKLVSNSGDQLKWFIDQIKQSDFIIFDNQYDLAAHKSEVTIDNTVHVLSNVNIAEDSVVEGKGLGTLSEEFLGDYNPLFHAIRKINPGIQFLFVQYPIVKGEDRSADHRKRRFNRSITTAKCRSSWEFFSTPLYEVGLDCVSEHNVNHFVPDLYSELADICDKIIVGGIDLDFNVTSPLNCYVRGAESPYATLPDRQYWKPAVAEPYPLAITDLYRKKFDIGIKDAVATCGSCFAQHIGKRLDRKGYNYLDVEPVPEDLPAEEAKSLGYGIYSARYGNVYTSRQLIQLFQRAFGELGFDEVWKNKAGRYVDPFRPNLCGEGYSTAEEVLNEQRQHLSKVRRMFESLDVFVFTMGVTETWVNRQTGAAYPICPGVTAGSFEPDQHEFVNLDYATIVEEVEGFLSGLRKVNPNAKVLLTVSPVPLTATAEDRHVLLSTMASKSILRAVADQLYRRHGHVDYFPSYDIIMSPPFKSMFFKSNLRSIHEEGVDYVMSHFFAEHRLEGANGSKPGVSAAVPTEPAPSETIEEDDDEAFCDEAFLELERRAGKS